MSTQSQANFNQPQSLVKYSNPVLVSTAGKKQNKVPFLLCRKKYLKMSPTPTQKTSSTPFFPQDSTPQKNNNFGNSYEN